MPSPKDPIKYQEWKRKLSESHKGYKMPEEIKRKISKANRGKKKPPRSEEHKKNISKANKGRIGYFKGKKHTEETKKRIGENTIRMFEKNPKLKEQIAKKLHGIKPSLNTRKKMSESRKGEKSYNWKGGITPENHKIRNSIEFRLWRESVFARDNWTCQKCEQKGYELHPHHIKNFADYSELRFAIDNGITFCKKCHKLFHHIFGNKNNNQEQIKMFLDLKLLIYQQDSKFKEIKIPLCPMPKKNQLPN